CADCSGLSLAERCSRALGRQLPSRTAGSRACHQRVASEAAPLFLCRVLPPGSDSLRTAEADSGKANALLRPREGGGVASCRRPSSSLRTRCLNCCSAHFTRELFVAACESYPWSAWLSTSIPVGTIAG